MKLDFSQKNVEFLGPIFLQFQFHQIKSIVAGFKLCPILFCSAARFNVFYELFLTSSACGASHNVSVTVTLILSKKRYEDDVGGHTHATS